jgi:hypothetical protein
VSLSGQHVTIYDAEGKILRAPVSTGQTGYETPAGIFSILEKNREHYSNLYDDAEMPFMQRITWSGIALHAGVLPGHPASHGCIRMPYRFAEQLFELTQKGLRVVIVRDDMSPAEIAHPALFKPGPIRSEVVLASAADTASSSTDARHAARHAAADAATARPDLRAIAAARRLPRRRRDNRKRRGSRRKGSVECGATRERLRAAENAVRRAEARVKDAERVLATASRATATGRPRRSRPRRLRAHRHAAQLDGVRPRRSR